MILDLRQAIIKRVNNKSDEEVYSIINDSIGGDDKALPGLGVLFEIIWENSEKQLQDRMVSVLVSHLK
jgi:small acid-soluble spore protein I (minor)